MKELFWYRSHVLDPYADDAVADQSDITERWNRQYKCDSIVETIGTKQCQINIDLFINEIQVQLDEQSLFEFYYDVFSKINEVYQMGVLDEHRDNKILTNYSEEVKKLLLFMENKYKNFLVDILLPIFDINYKITEQYIKDSFSKLRIGIEKRKKTECYLLQYFFTYASLEDRCHCIYQLLLKDMINFNTKCSLIKYSKEEKKNDNNQIGTDGN